MLKIFVSMYKDIHCYAVSSLSVCSKSLFQVCHGQMLTKIILNSQGLLRKDMQSINIVVPHLVKALELILPPKEVTFK